MSHEPEFPDFSHTVDDMGTVTPDDDIDIFERDVAETVRDIAEVPAAELVMTVSVHLMSAAAVKLGLGDGPDAATEIDLDEARKIITALAGLVTAAAPESGGVHARAPRDGRRTLQLAFREASSFPDAPGKGPGEKWTGSVI